VTSTSNIEDSEPSIAVVICTHNRPALLERCLQRLQQVDDPDFSVVVVDSAQNSSEAKLVAARWGPHRFYIDRASPQWFERANFGGIGDENLPCVTMSLTKFEVLMNGSVVAR
jgi:Glycosyl transferase family 2